MRINVEENYIMTHKEVQAMTRSFLVAKGYKVITKHYHKKVMASIKSHSSLDRIKYDDVFMAPDGEKIICEYKPSPVTRTTIYTGFGQCLSAFAESGLRSYLVISQNDLLKFMTVVANAPWLGLFVYEEGKVVSWRRPLELLSLPNPNEMKGV